MRSRLLETQIPGSAKSRVQPTGFAWPAYSETIDLGSLTDGRPTRLFPASPFQPSTVDAVLARYTQLAYDWAGGVHRGAALHAAPPGLPDGRRISQASAAFELRSG